MKWLGHQIFRSTRANHFEMRDIVRVRLLRMSYPVQSALSVPFLCGCKLAERDVQAITDVRQTLLCTEVATAFM